MLNDEGDPSVVMGNNEEICFSTEWAVSIGLCEVTSECIHVHRQQLAVSMSVPTRKGAVLR